MTLDRRTRLVPLIVACALFMENLDSTIIATALPAISHSLHENALRLSLAITAYLLSLAVFIPLSGWAADRHGARRVFRSAIIVFTLGSILCGVSQSMPGLVAARVLQGMGGAMMVPVGRLLLLREIPKHQLVAAMSWLTIPALMAPLFGPPLGGFIVTYASWRWIFFINVPIGVFGFLLVSRYIREAPMPRPPPLDLRGWLLVGSGLAATMFSFESMGKQVLPAAYVAALAGAGVTLLGLYVLHTRHRARPILDLRLLGLPTYGIALAGGSLFRMGTGAYTLLMPLMLQLGFGLTALSSGLITFASAAGALLMKTSAPRIVRRFGFRRLLVGNALVCSGFLLLCGLFRADTPHALIWVALLCMGFFRSLQFTCVNTMSYSDISESRMSQATSFSSTAQQLSLSVGVGVAAQLLHASLWLHQHSVLTPDDFTLAFALVAAGTALSSLLFRRLRDDAGSSVSGHVLDAPAARG